MSGNGDEERSVAAVALSQRKLVVIAFAVGTLVCIGSLLFIGESNHKAPPAVKQAQPDYEKYDSPEMSSKFFAARGGDEFHRFDCELVKEIKPENLLVFDNFVEARYSSQKPCLECNP